MSLKTSISFDFIFSKSEINDTPSRRDGFSAEKELNYRQQAANLIQDIGQRLQVTQLCINTAIVFMHRFFMFHSLEKFHWNKIAQAAIFLSAKVEEQPRKMDHIIKISNQFGRVPPYAKPEAEKTELTTNENILLQTLGFSMTVDHPHSHVVRTCELVKASRDLAQTAYFLATNSLHLTPMCLQLKSTTIACVCIHLACKWSDYQIPCSSEGRPWYYYVDPDVTVDILEAWAESFLQILENSPTRIKKKILNFKNGTSGREVANVAAQPSGAQPGPSSRSLSQASASVGAPSGTNGSSSMPPTAGPSNRPTQPKASSGAQRPSAAVGRPSTSTSAPPSSEGLRRTRTEPILHMATSIGQPAAPKPNALTASEYKQRQQKVATDKAASSSHPHADKKYPMHASNVNVSIGKQEESRTQDSTANILNQPNKDASIDAEIAGMSSREPPPPPPSTSVAAVPTVKALPILPIPVLGAHSVGLLKHPMKPVVGDTKPVVGDTKPGVGDTKPGVGDTKPGVGDNSSRSSAYEDKIAAGSANISQILKKSFSSTTQKEKKIKPEVVPAAVCDERFNAPVAANLGTAPAHLSSASASASAAAPQHPTEQLVSPPRVAIERDMLVHSEQRKRNRTLSITVEDKELMSQRRGTSPKIFLEKVDSSDSEQQHTVNSDATPSKRIKMEHVIEEKEVTPELPLPAHIKVKIDLKSLNSSPVSDSGSHRSKHKKSKKHKSHKSHKSHHRHHRGDEEAVSGAGAGDATATAAAAPLKMKIKISAGSQPLVVTNASHDSNSSSVRSSSHKQKSGKDRKRPRDREESTSESHKIARSESHSDVRHSAPKTPQREELLRTSDTLQKIIANRLSTLQQPPLPTQAMQQPPLPSSPPPM